MGVRDNYLIPREDLELEARPFASGGGGQVYRGTYNGTLVAAKSVFSQSLTTQLDEFNREVKMLATLAHPNIVTVRGDDVGDGTRRNGGKGGGGGGE